MLLILLLLLFPLAFCAPTIVGATVNLHTPPYATTLRLDLSGSGTQSVTLQRRAFGPGIALSSTTTVFSGSVAPAADGDYYVTDTQALAPGATYVYSGNSVGGDFVVGAADRRHSVAQAIVVVSADVASHSAAAVAGYVDDLIADGYTVARIDLSATASTESVRQAIQAARAQTRSIVALLGRVPIVYTGSSSQIDGHGSHSGAAPTDQYYGTATAAGWTDQSVNNNGGSIAVDRYAHVNVPGDGRFDQEKPPSAMTVGIGRVDFFNLSVSASGAVASEASLFQQYMSKVAAFKRDSNFVLPEKGLFTSHWGDVAAYDGLQRALWGQGNGFGLNGESWAAGTAGGKAAVTSAAQACTTAFIGFPGQNHERQSISDGTTMTYDMWASSNQAGFINLLSSYNYNWDFWRASLRTMLLGPKGLASSFTKGYWWSQGVPATVVGFAWAYVLGGAPIGAANFAVLNQYRTQLAYTKGFFNLMGDPSLRFAYGAPPSAVQLDAAARTVTWSAPADVNLVGFHVYRSAAGGAQPFTLLNDAPLPATTTSYVDAAAAAGVAYRYMVRALSVRHNVADGVRSYYREELSLGAFSAVGAIGGGTAQPTPAQTQQPTPSTPQPTPPTPQLTPPTPQPTPSTPQPTPSTPFPPPLMSFPSAMPVPGPSVADNDTLAPTPPAPPPPPPPPPPPSPSPTAAICSSARGGCCGVECPSDAPSSDQLALAAALVSVAVCAVLGVVVAAACLLYRRRRRPSAALDTRRASASGASSASSPRGSRVQRRSRQPTTQGGGRLSNVFAASYRVPSAVFQADQSSDFFYSRGRTPSRPAFPVAAAAPMPPQRRLPPPPLAPSRSRPPPPVPPSGPPPLAVPQWPRRPLPSPPTWSK